MQVHNHLDYSSKTIASNSTVTQVKQMPCNYSWSSS
jgi:hypothetical protein